MIATTIFRQPTSDVVSWTSPGTSPEADFLSQRLEEWIKDSENAESLYAPAIRELEDTFLDCRSQNWDGYEALQVSDETFLRSRQFLSRLMGQFPAPTTSATPGGSLAFEWFVSPKRRFLVSIGEGERIAYAGLFGADPAHGTAEFTDEMPPEIVQHLRRLFFH
jgi:hypothetical protein